MRTVGSWFKLLLVGADGMIGTRKNDLFHSCLPGRLKHMIRPDDIVVQHGFPGAIDSRARSQVHHTLHPLESRNQCLHTFRNIDNDSLLARNWLQRAKAELVLSGEILPSARPNASFCSSN